MSRMSKSMWLRRVSQLGLAGSLLLPLSLSGADAAEQTKNNVQSVYDQQNSSLRQLFKRSCRQRMGAYRGYAEASKLGVYNRSARRQRICRRARRRCHHKSVCSVCMNKLISVGKLNIYYSRRRSVGYRRLVKGIARELLLSVL